MLLNVKQAQTFVGCAKPRFLKYNLPHIMQGKKKMYRLKDIEKICSDTSPRVLPDTTSALDDVVNTIASFDPQTLGQDIFNENLEDFTKDTVEVTKLCQSIAFNVSVRDFIETTIVANPLELDISTLLGKYMQQYKLLLDSKKRLIDVQKTK